MSHKRWKTKRFLKMIKRQNRKQKAGKPVFFTLTHCGKLQHGYSDRYNYKSNLHKLSYKQQKFNNIRFQACIITQCSFKSATLNGVDFISCNLRKTSFKEAKLNYCLFEKCLLDKADFTGASFTNCAFVNTNMDVLQKIVTTADSTNNKNSSLKIYSRYSNVDAFLSKNYKDKLRDLAYMPVYPNMYNRTKIWYKALFVKPDKINAWILQVLADWCNNDSVSNFDCFIEQLCKINLKKMKLYSIKSIFDAVMRKSKNA